MNLNTFVSIVLLSYNRPNFLRQALRSVLNQTYRDFEIIVVDNRSEGSDKVAEIVSQFAEVKLILNDRNLGFTGGMNVGLRQARGQYVYFTEDDILLSRNCVSDLVTALSSDGTIGLASPVMLNHGTKTIRCAGAAINLFPLLSLTIKDKLLTSEYGTTYSVQYIPGASIMARTSEMRKWGGFRPDFFLYVEDVDLCMRVQSAGLRIVVVTSASVEHFEPSPGAVTSSVEYHKTKNLMALYILHTPLSKAIPVLAKIIIHSLASRTSVINFLLVTLRASWWVLRNFRFLLSERGSVNVNNPLLIQ